VTDAHGCCWSLQAWLADAAVKIFPTTTPPADVVGALVPPRPNTHICTAQREHMPFQVGIRPAAALAGTRLVATSSDPALKVAVSLVVNVPVSVAINARNTTGLFPDALPAVPAAGITLEAASTTAFWVSVVSNISGTYTVSLALSTGSGPTAIIGEVDVTVLGFQIPERSSFLADSGVEFAPFFQWGATPADGRAALIKGVYAQLAEYRINRLVACDGVTALGAPTARIKLDSDDDDSAHTAAVELDTEAMDEMIEYVLSLGFQTFALPEIADCAHAMPFLSMVT
jgi:hypothetical protein